MEAQVAPAYSTAEAAASEATSAFCQDRLEDIWIIPVVKTELKFRQVQGQVFRAQFREIVIAHCGADAMEHVPSRAVIATADLPMNLQSRDPFFALAHQVDDLEPSLERIVGILEDRLGNDAEAIARPLAA